MLVMLLAVIVIGVLTTLGIRPAVPARTVGPTS